MSKYTSSVINNYGDPVRVHQDARTVIDVLNRQGSRLLLEILADNIGKVSLKYGLTYDESKRALDSLLKELTELTHERL